MTWLYVGGVAVTLGALAIALLIASAGFWERD